MNRIGVLTSGGDAPGMNAAIRAVVRMSIFHGLQVTGIKRGYLGLLKKEFVRYSLGSVADIIHRGGTILHTARCEEFKTEEGQRKAIKNLQEEGIDALVVIGGEGSMRGALALAKYGIPVVGIPATIDNDLADTELSIGFDTAVNNVVDAINKIRDTATSHERVFIIEVMGRKTGQIALYAGLAGGAESILLPEIDVDMNEVIFKLERGINRGKLHSIIIVAEGAASAINVGDEIRKRTGLETRITILGHLQRGGTPTATDRMLASRMGAKAVELLLQGINRKMVGVAAGELLALDLEDVLGREKALDRSIWELAAILAI
ncbi:MAG: 6-phosphofructokinase [Thermacetogeniaceae bacterium]|nr:6-phosphofructokinase [Thermoanaerobacterales bacterium]NLN21011.1 6-phosphofructokinase [Syntrophomonadaceae bacterium]